jgi:polysaccharide export outer membrane protein
MTSVGICIDLIQPPVATNRIHIFEMMKYPNVPHFLAVLLLFTFAGQANIAFGDEAVLRAGDKIKLEIKGVPDEEKTDLNGEYTIGENGTIPLPYIDDPVAVGEKPSALARKIASAYREAEIYTNPTFVINADSEASVRVISITGGVKQGGAINFYDGITLLRAISQAGGLSDFAKSKEVRLIRKGEAIEYNLNDIAGGKEADPRLDPGDQIVVPESGRKL